MTADLSGGNLTSGAADSSLGFLSAYRGRRVLVTGHTGFKGSWLSLWLGQLGADVYGLALPPEERGLFHDAGIGEIVHEAHTDVRNRGAVDEVLRAVQPDIIFHMAAQSLVRRGYAMPLDTFDINVMGTAHVLESARGVPSLAAVIVVTSDKCYRNENSIWSFRENDPLGGDDPYSASKACAEVVAAAYRGSYFNSPSSPLVATARAGNVIGGGDWSEDRLLPDIASALMAGRQAILRNPQSTRPWQHVLEPLRGYLMLGSRLLRKDPEFAQAWNFGPPDGDIRSVREVADRTIESWGIGSVALAESEGSLPEATSLNLDSSKARQLLGYRPLLEFDEAIDLTVDWYKLYAESVESSRTITEDQIRAYTKLIVNG